MAQAGRKNAQGPGKGSGSSNKKSNNRGKKSVAAARGASTSNRMPYIIGGVALIVIIAIITFGVLNTNKQMKVQAAGYGDSVASTATLGDDGTIIVSNGDPDLVLDIYEDAICPFCAQLEHQYGQQINQAIDDGQLAVRYDMVDMLNASSASGDYSTRAYAAMLSIAKNDGSTPGVLMNFHASLFNQANQPAENGSSDLSNDDLAALAGDVGASEETQQKIKDGAEIDTAKSSAADHFDDLQQVAAAAGRQSAGTPTVAKDGKAIDTSQTNWLTNLLPADYTPTPATDEDSGTK